jgi:hypothetical protein
MPDGNQRLDFVGRYGVRVAADASHGQAAAPPRRRALSTSEEWAAYCRAEWARLPAWGFDRAFVAELAADHLPRVLAAMGVARLIGRISNDARQLVGRGAPLSAMPLAPDGRWFLMRLRPPDEVLIALDPWSHRWRCPALDGIGDDLIDLGVWRWRMTPAKTAFRIARLCGRQRPVP